MGFFSRKPKAAPVPSPRAAASTASRAPASSAPPQQRAQPAPSAPSAPVAPSAPAAPAPVTPSSSSSRSKQAPAAAVPLLNSAASTPVASPAASPAPSPSNAAKSPSRKSTRAPSTSSAPSSPKVPITPKQQQQQQTPDFRTYSGEVQATKNRGKSNVGKPSRCARCSASCYKNFLVAINCFFMLAGLVIMSLGAYTYTSKINDLVGHQSSVAVIVAGLCVSFISFVGCNGARRLSRCLLFLYFVGLLLMVVTQVAVATYIFVEHEKAHTVISDAWGRADDSLKSKVQNELNCCGLDQFGQNAAQPCPTGATQSCFAAVKTVLQSHFKMTAIAIISFAAVQLVALLFAWKLMKALKSEEMRSLLSRQKQQQRSSCV